MIDLLYSKFYNDLLRFCISLSHDYAFAEDIVQETYLRALANADILERLELKDCVNVSCFPGQRSAVEEVSDDVVNIDDSGKGLKGLISSLIPGVGNLEDTKVINATSYTL